MDDPPPRRLVPVMVIIDPNCPCEGDIEVIRPGGVYIHMLDVDRTCAKVSEMMVIGTATFEVVSNTPALTYTDVLVVWLCMTLALVCPRETDVILVP